MAINDRNWKFLRDATGLSLPYNEMYFRYLRGLGYTGTLQQMIAKSKKGLNPVINSGNPASKGSKADPIVILGSSLLAWWSADRVDLITLSGSQVTSWRDIIAGYDVVQAVSAARPLYSATSFNGAPGVTADAVDDELTITPVPATFPIGGDASEMWSIVSQDLPAATTGIRFLAAYGGATNFRRSSGRNTVAGVNRGENRGGTGVSETANQELTVDLSVRHVIRSRFNGATNTIGLTIDSGAEATTAVTISGTTADRLRLFANTNVTASAFYGGTLRDHLVTGPLTDPQAAALTAWALSRRML
jgi:hypothetical protein